MTPPAAIDYSTLKITEPPSAGFYFGAYEWTAGDIASVEAAAGIRTSHYSATSGNWSSGAMSYVSGHPRFSASVANTVWAQGRVCVAQTYNLYAGTDTEHPAGFTVDKLLAGQYDSNLATLASDLRAFGKPVWIQCGREPNGVGQDYMGGFGADGTASLSTAITNGTAYNQFIPPAVPAGAPSNLYEDCSGAAIPDGVGRLKAGQRYIHDYLVRRQGLHFLTWDSQGWNVRYYKDAVDNQDKYDSADYVGHEAYALQVLQDCNFANFYPGDAYCDWPSITFYTLDYYDASWSWLSGSDILLPTADWLTSLSQVYNQIRSVTQKPIILVECGFPDGMDSNTTYGAEKLTTCLNAFLTTYTGIKAVSMWSNSVNWFVADNFPYDCLLRSNTTQSTALRSIIAANRTKFHTSVTLTNNIPHPYRP